MRISLLDNTCNHSSVARLPKNTPVIVQFPGGHTSVDSKGGVDHVVVQDANGNFYGPVSGQFTTQVHNNLFGATLALAPTSAGPNLLGTTQTLTLHLIEPAGKGTPQIWQQPGVNPLKLVVSNQPC